MMPGRKILIVEDEEVLADNLKIYLERSSCVAEIAADGASAIAMVEAFAPECVVLDYRLPDMDGFAALDSLYQQRGRVPCVLITGHPTSEVYSGAASRGIDHILFKPFPLSELSGVIGRMLLALDDHPVGPECPAELPPFLREERRKVQVGGFPLRLFDGTWLETDRRHPARLTAPLRKSNGGADLSAPNKNGCGLIPR